MERRAYRITGMVQGVGYRFFTRSQARALELNGWVCNKTDGSVEVHVEGVNHILDNFEQLLGQGPSTVHVDEVKRIPSKDDSQLTEFEIRFG